MRSNAIENLKRELELNDVQREVLFGILLGDACLETQNRGRTYRLKIEQSAQHEAYVRHQYDLFRDWVLTPPRERIVSASNGSETKSWVFSTVSHSTFRFFAHQFYGDEGKRVPELLHRWLTPRGLAYWYMDDGSMKSSQSKGVLFNTQGFARNDVDALVVILHSKFGLQAAPRHQSDGWQIYVSGASFETFLGLVDPHVILEMRYKIPQARRTHLPKR
jgi:hypothetical protein